MHVEQSSRSCLHLRRGGGEKAMSIKLQLKRTKLTLRIVLAICLQLWRLLRDQLVQLAVEK